MLQHEGYAVSMAPPESYLDVSTSNFSRFVNLTYPNDAWHQDFSYHGRNVYAYLLKKWPDAFDIISVQLYESWSHADYNITVLGTPASDYLVAYIENFVRHSGKVLVLINPL